MSNDEVYLGPSSSSYGSRRLLEQPLRQLLSGPRAIRSQGCHGTERSLSRRHSASTDEYRSMDTAINRPDRPSYLKLQRDKIRTYITDQLQDSWDYSDSGQFYRELHPTVSYRVRHQYHSSMQ